MSVFNTMSGQTFTLGSSISSTQTTILLTSFTVPVSGTNITMATMNTSVAYGTLAPGTSSAELISFTGVTQNSDGTATLTGVTRGLDKQYPYAESSSFKQPHAGQTIFILSDAPQVFSQYPAKVNDETITGRFTFPTSGTASAARAGATYAAPVQDTELATKKYVDNTAIFGAPFATTTTAGIVQLPTETQVESGTQIGSTTAQLALPNVSYGARNYAGVATGSGGTTTYTVAMSPTRLALSTGLVVGVIMPNQNTGNATINVDGTGAKSIRLGATGLFAGAFSTNSVVGLQYNGTSFDMIWSSDMISASNTANTVALRRSTGDLAVPTTPTNSTDAASKSYVDAAPSKTLLYQSSIPITLDSSNTNENAFLTKSIVGGTLSTGNVVRVTMYGTWVNNSGTAAVTLRMKYGATTVASLSLTETGSTTQNFSWVFNLYATGATGTQTGKTTFFAIGNNTTPATNASILSSTTTGNATEDSTAAKNFVLSSQFSTTTNAQTININEYTIEALRQ